MSNYIVNKCCFAFLQLDQGFFKERESLYLYPEFCNDRLKPSYNSGSSMRNLQQLSRA